MQSSVFRRQGMSKYPKSQNRLVETIGFFWLLLTILKYMNQENKLSDLNSHLKVCIKNLKTSWLFGEKFIYLSLLGHDFPKNKHKENATDKSDTLWIKFPNTIVSFHDSNILEKERSHENCHEVCDESWWVNIKKTSWLSLSIKVSSPLHFGYVTYLFPKK